MIVLSPFRVDKWLCTADIGGLFFFSIRSSSSNNNNNNNSIHSDRDTPFRLQEEGENPIRDGDKMSDLLKHYLICNNLCKSLVK